MHTKTAPPLSIGRREFIASAAGIVATGLAATSPLSLLSGIGQEDVDLAMPIPTTKRLHLDLHEAKRIVSQFVAEGYKGDDRDTDFNYYLNLRAYASASLDALDHLASIDAGQINIGFESLDPDMAELIAKWNTFFLIFDRLDKLTPDVTRHLNLSNHALVFVNLKHFDVEAARYLVGDGYHAQLLTDIPGALTLPMAKALSRHRTGLCITVSSLEHQAARALSRHVGNFLGVYSKLPFSKGSLRAFSGNAKKRLVTDSGQYGIYGSGEYGYKLEWRATPNWSYVKGSHV